MKNTPAPAALLRIRKIISCVTPPAPLPPLRAAGGRSSRAVPGIALALAFAAGPAAVDAAVSNVIVWTTARTSTQLNTTLQNAPTSSPDMRLWWKCDSGANVGWDSTGNARHAAIKGTVAGIPMLNPWGVSRTVASGFNAPFCYLVGDPGIAYTASRTYEFWVRNPGKNDSVFFSLLRSKTGQVRGGQAADMMRMWVQADGSLKMADRGTGTGLLTPSTVKSRSMAAALQ